MNNYADSEIVNIGTGEDLTIKDLAQMIKEIVGYEGKTTWDASKPDGTPRKLLDVSHLAEAGWHYSIKRRKGITQTYSWFTESRR